METWKIISFFAGIICILFGIIAFGFYPAVNQLLHDDEVTYFSATLVDVDQTAIYHRLHGRYSRSRGYTTYMNKLTFKSSDSNYPNTITIEEETVSRNVYLEKKNTTFTIYNYKDKYAIKRDELFTSKTIKGVGPGIIAIGLAAIIFPLGVEKNRYR